jgi:hypothetical protein
MVHGTRGDTIMISNTASSCSSSAPFLAALPFDDQFPQGGWQYYLLSSILLDDFQRICLWDIRKGGQPKLKDPPSISFQAFKKSSGSENATKPYLA